MNAVILQNLVKRFGKKTALDGISLQLEENRIRADRKKRCRQD